MNNPIDVERRFLELTSSLNSISSLRLRWRLIENFLEHIENEFHRFDSYLIQLATYLPVFKHPLSYSGSDPNKLQNVISLLLKCEEAVPSLTEIPKFNEARDSLVQATGLLYALTGSLKQLVYVYTTAYESTNENRFDWIEELYHEANTKNFERLSRLIKAARNQGLSGLSSWLIALKDTWEDQLQPTQHSILIPVVEQSNQYQVGNSGRLRRIHLQVLRENEGQSDHLQSNFAVWGAEKSSSEFGSSIVLATRNLLNATHPSLQDYYYDLQLRYHMQSGWHTGRSSELGAASLMYCAILKYADQRKRFGLREAIALSGCLDKDGNILPVDPEGIGQKMEAAFFSWVQYLVVPKQQEETFKKKSKSLKNKFPYRDLVVLGIERLEELFYDRRISNQIVDSRTVFYTKKLWRQKTSVAGISAIVLLLLIIGRLVYGPLDKNPVAASFDGSLMLVENRFGNVIRQIEVGSYTVDRMNSNSRSIPYAFIDINEDGTNEILWSELLSSNISNQQVSYLHCLDVANDTLLWSVPLEFKLDFPRKGDVSTHLYDVHLMRYLKENTTAGSKLIVTVQHTNFFPSMLLAIDPLTGKIAGRYIHTGQIADFELVDLNKDNQPEIIALAQNNAFDEVTTLAVLDPDELVGHSPLQGDYALNGVGRASEIAYIAIPQTIVGKAFKKRVVNNLPEYLTINTEEKLIEVRVNDFNLSDATLFEADYGALIFYFDYNLELQSVGTDSNYDLWARNLFEEGRIPFIPDYDYFQAYEDSLQYWVRDGFYSDTLHATTD